MTYYLYSRYKRSEQVVTSEFSCSLKVRKQFKLEKYFYIDICHEDWYVSLSQHSPPAPTGLGGV